jgi:transposase
MKRLTSQKVTALHACMEATSTYGNDLARFLFESGYKVSIVNPSRTKAFGRSQLSRTKTNRTDAKTIAQSWLRFAIGVRLKVLTSWLLLRG